MSSYLQLTTKNKSSFPLQNSWPRPIVTVATWWSSTVIQLKLSHPAIQISPSENFWLRPINTVATVRKQSSGFPLQNLWLRHIVTVATSTDRPKYFIRKPHTKKLISELIDLIFLEFWLWKIPSELLKSVLKIIALWYSSEKTAKLLQAITNSINTIGAIDLMLISGQSVPDPTPKSDWLLYQQ
jgi:hypothetical protein